ncbi:MAG: hypothetical protein HOP00_12840 [Nitrospira sp.]|nr:hypothetical protein [Nitrospira sp.]
MVADFLAARPPEVIAAEARKAAHQAELSKPVKFSRWIELHRSDYLARLKIS